MLLCHHFANDELQKYLQIKRLPFLLPIPGLLFFFFLPLTVLARHTVWIAERRLRLRIVDQRIATIRTSNTIEASPPPPVSKTTRDQGHASLPQKDRFVVLTSCATMGIFCEELNRVGKHATYTG